MNSDKMPPAVRRGAAPPAGQTSGRDSLRLRVFGTVQGVGFRPYVYRLATELNLSGWVRNEGTCVSIFVSGDTRRVSAFCHRLQSEPPVAAVIDSIVYESVSCAEDPISRERLEAPSGDQAFQILSSSRGLSNRAVSIPPDLAICDDCLADMANPESRYYQYPFTSCTQCGPRYTLVRTLPFDRQTTSMEAFPLCPTCEQDYEAPESRRFHAQATACPTCGPTLRYFARSESAAGQDAILRARDALAAGLIVAVMGVGGLHLAARVDPDPLVRLRDRKRRPGKPFALMMNEGEVEKYCFVDDEEWRQLKSRERPIVLLRRRPDSVLPEEVAPGLARLGVFLPYTGVQVLLLQDPRLPYLVMTSANQSGDPLVYTVREAAFRLSGVADGFLVHNREILRPVDDSVIRVHGSEAILLRRARGYVPISFHVPRPCASVSALAVGSDLKNAFAILHGDHLWLGPHVGDLEEARTFELFKHEVEWYEELLEVSPDVVVHDKHPNYYSTRYAATRIGHRFAVQHHHAHMAACLLEYAVDQPALGVILDGLGYGDDGGLWGGEFLLGDAVTYQRVGHIQPVRWIGGDMAVKEPWRAVLNYLHEAGLSDATDWIALRLGIPRDKREMHERILQSTYPGLACTSTGRLFDVVGAMVCAMGTASYESELPMRLEASVNPQIKGAYPFPNETQDGRRVVSLHDALRSVVRDLFRGTTAPVIATQFHRGFASGLARLSLTLAAQFGVRTLALGGGVWQNEWLLRFYLEALAQEVHVRAPGDARDSSEGPLHDGELRVLFPTRFPVGDGGLAVGQLAVFLGSLR